MNNENLSLEAKICGRKKIFFFLIIVQKIISPGYCFAKCQQQFAACLLAQMTAVFNGSLDVCQEKSQKCEKRCFNDKRTSRIAEANWAKVVKVLQQFNTFSTIEEKKQNQ